jgi:serine/threonine-protein kinase
MTQQDINNTSMLKVGTILHDTYRIDSYLSSGGFGNTYVATNIEFEERVAIKEFFMKGVTQRDDNQTTVSVSNTENSNSFLEQKEKFKKEARRIRQLKNEHIVAVHDMFEENGTAYYVMDYVDGENLAERLKRTGKPMTEQEVCAILPQILDALKSVHDEGMWHLDLKPANIMVDKAGNVKLIDFGASKQLNAQKGGATTSTAISYTNGYAPREQMEQNYDKFGPWTDIYALGATLYNLLTNKRPPLPTDIDDDETSDKHEALPFPDTVSSGTKSLVLMMLNTNRMRRPQSIDAILEAELLRKKETVQVPLQQTTPKHVADDDEEATIIANPQSKKEEKDAKPKPEPQPTVNPKPTQSAYTFTSLENNDNEGSSKGVIIGMIVAIIFVVIILANYGGCGNKVEYVNEQSVEKAEPQNVEPQKTESVWESPLGSCQYKGAVDESDLPHGRGEAKFSDGRYYSGGFSHGAFDGEQCYFTYPNGDSFFGEFRYNSFYQGKYTISKDGSYFKGYFKDGQPSSGTWYDKNGKVIEKI